MHRELLTMVCCSDIAGQVRGKGFPTRELKTRQVKGVGWTPTNIMITAFGPIADSPWGPFEDLALVPDPDTEVNVDFGDGSPTEHFFIGDLLHTDGKPWECCTRHFLRRALQALEKEANLRLVASFEHEFFYSGVAARPSSSYSLDAFRRQGIFAEALIRALRSAGLEPDTFMPEYGDQQYEITVAPAPALRAADRAVILRELARGTAHRLGEQVSFSPCRDPDSVGNGVHIHMSLRDIANQPVSYDPDKPHGLSEQAGRFVAGILHYMPALCALTAPSVVSYLRLVPQRWSAVYNNLGYRDREAGVRICPVVTLPGTANIAEQYNFEYRAADATASPYLALGALVWAGLEGIRQRLPVPEATTRNPAELSVKEREKRGIVRLPEFLEAALETLEHTPEAKQWLGETLLRVYLRHKRTEMSIVKHLDQHQQCKRYSEVY